MERARTRDVERVGNVPSRLSDWIVAHPVVWGVGLGALLVLLGVVFDLSPIVVMLVGAGLGVLNILHARRRGYCLLPSERAARSARAAVEPALPEPGDG